MTQARWVAGIRNKAGGVRIFVEAAAKAVLEYAAEVEHYPSTGNVYQLQAELDLATRSGRMS